MEPRIEGRKWAEDTVAVAETTGGEFLEGFIRAIKRKYADILVPDMAMSREEAKAYEAELARGIYAYSTPSQLAWIVDQHEKMRRYVKSARFKELLDQETE